MTVYVSLVVGCWLIFLIVWLVSGVGTYKNISNYGRSSWLRLGAAVILVAVLSLPGLNPFSEIRLSGAVVQLLGVVFTALGIAFATWARMSLGKNWGMPMTIKENPELVSSGPYAYVRHPIYTGIIFALIGTALVTGLAAAVALVFFTAYFLYSAKQEEAQMLKEFPDTYPGYMRQTKMLIPFVV
jgi:protein-S-isoprenylcysteine O-methyltransferase Ste14